MSDHSPVRFQINNAQIQKRKEPWINFDLSIFVENQTSPTQPYVFSIERCFAKTYKKHADPATNPQGWKWCGPLMGSRSVTWTNYHFSKSFHDVILGILATAPHGKSGVPILTQAERLCAEYLDEKWRVPSEDDELGGILFK